MGLFGRKKTTVGLDIGSGLIKVAVIDHSKKEPELVKVAIIPLLADATVPSSSAPIARRRVHALLERAPTIDSATVSRVRPIARWASGDLY